VLGPKIFGGAGRGKGKGKGRGGKIEKGRASSGEKKVKVVVPAKLSGNYPESVKAYDVSLRSLFSLYSRRNRRRPGQLGRTRRTHAD